MYEPSEHYFLTFLNLYPLWIFCVCCGFCVVWVLFVIVGISKDEENELHHQEAEIELQRKRKKDEYHDWKGEKVNFDEEKVYPRIEQLQIENYNRQVKKREKELQLIRIAKEKLIEVEKAREIRLQNRELLERAKKWFHNSGVKKVFFAWKGLVKENIHIRATARCNGRQSKGGCCCWHCWPWSCRCCCCKIPQPAKKKKKKRKLKKISRKNNQIQNYQTGSAKY